MAKILFFNFDGTDNEPSDAAQDKSAVRGTIEDNSITNILKFHLLLGGNLKEANGNTTLENGSRSFYYHGVGTYGNFFQRKFNAAVAKEGADVATILRLAKKDFREHFIPSNGYEYIVVTGFSRGAALARRFAAIINDMVGDTPIIIEGVFDTVASIGMPNLSKKDRPTTEVVFENGHTLPDKVMRALHLLSLDDKRKAFQPTLMNQDDRVEEIWFAGAHSDVGGGYNFDGLSDNALRYFLDWFEEQAALGIQFKSSKNVDYTAIFGDQSKLKIGSDDVQIDPNPFGVNHQQDRWPLIDRLTLTDRLCCIIKNDRIVKGEAPTVHWSVAERINKDRSYRPESLKNTNHQICYQDQSKRAFQGFSQHKLKSMSNFRIAGANPIETRVYAHLKYNHTGIYLEEGKSYLIEVIELNHYKWRDGSIKPVDGNGWDRDDVRLGLKEIAIAAMEPFRRVPKADWFTLCGCIDANDKNAQMIGNRHNFVPDRSGEFFAFANDLDGYYGNNSGFLKIRITKVAK